MFPTRLFAVWLAILIAGQGAAQMAVPEHRFVYTQDVDFYGADLSNQFDTTAAACQRACAAQQECVAFTFNTRSNACFPKSAVTDRQPYAGALSAIKTGTDARVLQSAPNLEASLSFLEQTDLSSARALVGRNAQRHPLAGEPLGDLILAMDRAVQQGNIASALRWMGKGIALSDSGDLWSRRAWIGLRENPSLSRKERRRLQREAIPAAVNAYLRAINTPAQVTALDLLAQALEANNRGRDMIPVLRLALSLEPRDALAERLDDAIGKYGFRVIEHRVDSNAAAPRICAEFSEKLVQAGVDYEPFVQLDTRGLVVDAQGSQICIDGVAHGARYQMTLRAGLPAASGETLHKDVRLQLYVRDRAPSVRFSGRAYVLPRSSTAAIPVETVNTDVLDLTLRRVSDRNLVRTIQDSYFGKPLSKYEADIFAATLAREVWAGTGKVQNTLNADMTTRLPLGDALTDLSPGIYALSAAVPGQDPYDNPAATQWFVLSDLGLSTWAGTDGIHVAIRGLSDAAPRAGVTVSLISQANAVLGQVKTDGQGMAAFAPGLSRGTGAAAPALLMAELPGQDVSFLPLTDPAFDLSDRGVEGHPPAPPIDTFLTTDRGAYRVGETIHATVLTRDDQGRAQEGLPLVAVLKRPDGVEYSRMLSQNSRAGGHVFALPLGADVPRGAWRLDVIADPSLGPLASQTVLVEDFLPERIDFDLLLPDAPVRLGDTPPLQITARYLFGAPGADLAVEGETRLRATRSIEDWPGYLFGPYDQRFDTRTRALEATRTGADGKAEIPVTLPKLDEVPGMPLEMNITLRVAEGSGRPVERQLTKALSPANPLIGIKPAFEDVLPQGAEARFELIALDPQGDLVAMPVQWTLNKISTRYQWYQLYGNWEWEPVTRRVRVAKGETTLGAAPVMLAQPTDWGQYELVIERLGAPFATSSVQFAAGWYGSTDGTDAPDRLAVTLDKDAYDVGETAQLRIISEDAGTAMVSVLSNRVISHKAVEIAAGETMIPVQVTADWGTGAYVTVAALRPLDESASLNPARRLGLAHAAVRPGDRELEVSLDAPQSVDGQSGSFTAQVQVNGIAPGDMAYVTLAAVDQGILNLTQFEDPDPKDHYFGQRRLGVEIRDVYGRLIDGLNGALGTVRSGGDAGSAAQTQSPPPTEDLMAFFSGPVAVGPDGRATIEIHKPAFNGSIRLMAVAWSKRGVGNAASDVLARDPVVLTASLPRFLAPGDQSRMLLEFTHTLGTHGDMAVSVAAGDGVTVSGVPETISLTDQGTTRLSLPLLADKIGDPELTVNLTTPEGKILKKTLRMPVRDNDPEIAVTRQFALGPGEAFTFDANVFAGLRPGTGSATLSAGPLARFDVPGLLRQLDRYPYGCTEQVTSGAMPLLYLSSVAQSAGLGAQDTLQAKVDAAIDKVLARQANNGAFGLWRASSGEFWLDAYVTDFLWRAQTQGYVVPPRAMSQAMDNLRNRISYAPDFDIGGEDLAYALLVLARAGAANIGDLRYYADTKGEAFGSPLATAQLGAALAAYGDPSRADRLFARAVSQLARARPDRGWRDDFGSTLRDAAAVVKLSTEAGSAVVDPSQMAQLFRPDSRRFSTQEAAQVVLAAHALTQPGANPGLRVDGAAPNGPVVKRLSDQRGAASVIENTGAVATDVTLTTFGIPEVPADAGGSGYAIRRTLYDLEGQELGKAVRAGSRMVVVIEVSPFEGTGARLIVDDPLPAGLEIDNPNLLRSGDVKSFDWLETISAEHAEFRSDRFVAAVDHSGTKAFRLAYVVRAVTPGQYHHPAATVADMYRPEFRANTASASLTVTP